MKHPFFNKKLLIFIAAVHCALTLSDIWLYDYQQVNDADRFLTVADEFASFHFSNLNPSLNCTTAPGYPVFLAIFKFLTQNNKYLIALCQSLLFCFIAYYFVRNLYKKNILSANAAFISFALILFSPEIYQTNSYTMSESLCFSSLLLTCALLLDDLNSKWTKTLFVVSSLVLCITRFEFIAFLPVFCFILYKRNKVKLIFISTTVLTVILVLNGYKNYLTYDIFNPLSYGSGTVMYAGNNLNGDASWHFATKSYAYFPAGRVEEFKKLDSQPAECACPQTDSLFKVMAIDAWKTDPALQLKNIPLKFGKLWALPSSLDIYTEDVTFKKGLHLSTLFDDTRWPTYGKYKHGFYLAIYWFYLLLIIAGVSIKIKSKGLSAPDYFVFILILLVSFFYSILFYGIGRFHVPVFPLLIPYAAFAVLAIDKSLFRGRFFSEEG